MSYLDRQISIFKNFADAVYKRFRQDRFGITVKFTKDYEKLANKLDICNWEKLAKENDIDDATVRTISNTAVYYNPLVRTGSRTTAPKINAPIDTNVTYNYGSEGQQNIIEINAGGAITRINVNPLININRNNEYTHEQLTPATEWLVVHNFGFIPNVYTTDLQGNEFEGIVVPVDDSTIKIVFTEPVSGYAYLS